MHLSKLIENNVGRQFPFTSILLNILFYCLRRIDRKVINKNTIYIIIHSLSENVSKLECKVDPRVKLTPTSTPNHSQMLF